MSDTISKLFVYDKWANDRLLGLVRNLPDENRRSIELIAHIVFAEKIWLMRLKGEDTSGINKMPELSLDECQRLTTELAAGYSEFIGSLSADGFETNVNYKNLAGEEFNTPVKDILTHVALHGSYHRGQAAAAIRAAGSSPIDTDFIVFVRTEPQL